MGSKVNFYTLAFETNNEEVVNRNIITFFKQFEQLFTRNNGDASCLMEKDLNNKKIRAFSYYWDVPSDRRLVIPFGKRKDKNMPYFNDGNSLTEINRELYDINSISYCLDNRIAMLTTNFQGPSCKDIEDYLTSFLNEDDGYVIRLRPIMYNTGIEQIRNAQQVRNVTFVLNLQQDLSRFYMQNVQYERQSIKESFKNIAIAAKEEINGNNLALCIGLGYERNATLNKDGLLGLINALNIPSEIIKEIYLNYKSGENEKVDIAKLKNSSQILWAHIGSNVNQVSPEMLRRELQRLVSEKRRMYSGRHREYFANCIEGDEEYELEVNTEVELEEANILVQQ